MHRRLTAAVAALALVTATSGLAQTPVPAPAPTTFDEAVGQIDANFDRRQTQAHAPGLIRGIVQDGRLRYVQFTGRRNLESQALN